MKTFIIQFKNLCSIFDCIEILSNFAKSSNSYTVVCSCIRKKNETYPLGKYKDKDSTFTSIYCNYRDHIILLFSSLDVTSMISNGINLSSVNGEILDLYFAILFEWNMIIFELMTCITAAFLVCQMTYTCTYLDMHNWSISNNFQSDQCRQQFFVNSLLQTHSGFKLVCFCINGMSALHLQFFK